MFRTRLSEARLALYLSLASFALSSYAVAYATNPEPIRLFLRRVSTWAGEPAPAPRGLSTPVPARLGARKAAEFGRRKALVEALERDRLKDQPPQQGPVVGPPVLP